MDFENGFLAGYWAYAFGVAAAFYATVSWFGKNHLSQSAKDDLSLWLMGAHEDTWSRQFCRLFDAVFGEKHLSLRCFLRFCRRCCILFGCRLQRTHFALHGFHFLLLLLEHLQQFFF